MREKGDRDAVKEQIRDATDIVYLIGQQVALKPAGKEFLGLCPFHDDKHASMHVSPDKQIYKCFSCGAGGDVFKFVEHYHHFSFPEAVNYLAERARIDIPSLRVDKDKDKDKIYSALEEAAVYFEKRLFNSESEAYLERRGINANSIRKFRLGHAENTWQDLYDHLKDDFSDDILYQAGLISIGNEERSGRVWDWFRNRVMFPIFDVRERIIGFGGRSLEKNDNVKYLNSRESKVFHKANTLYGLNFAIKELRKEGRLFVVEGYTDVVQAYQAGVKNIAATMGTALTEEHVEELSRRSGLAEKIITYDGDEAGQTAAYRASELLIGKGDYKISILTGGEDPAEIVERKGNLIEALTREVIQPSEFIYQTLIRGKDMSTADNKVLVLGKLREVISRVPDELRGVYFETLGQKLGLSERAVQSVLGSISKLVEPRRSIFESTEGFQFEFVRSLLPTDKRTLDYCLKLIKPKDLTSNVAREVFYYLQTRSNFLSSTGNLFKSVNEVHTPDMDSLPMYGQARKEQIAAYIRNQAMDQRQFLIAGEALSQLESILEGKSKSPNTEEMERIALLIRSQTVMRGLCLNAGTEFSYTDALEALNLLEMDVSGSLLKLKKESKKSKK